MADLFPLLLFIISSSSLMCDITLYRKYFPTAIHHMFIDQSIAYTFLFRSNILYLSPSLIIRAAV